MFANCFNKIMKTVGGKPLTQSEKDKLRAKFTQAFLQSVADGNSSATNTLVAAVGLMRKQQLHAKKLSAYRKLQQATILTSLDNWVDGTSFNTKSEAVTRLLANNFDMKTGKQSVEALQRGIVQSSSRPLREILNFIGRKGAGFVENSENAALFVRELYGENTGSAEARKAAAEWQAVADTLRNRFNRAGGDVAGMVNWIMPQSWSVRALSSAWKRHKNADSFKTDADRLAGSREVFVDDMFRTADRAKYIDYDTGIPMDDARLRAHLASSFNTVVTDGATKADPSAPNTGGGSISNREKAHRQIHIADADGWLEMSQSYGDGPVQSALVGHIKSMSGNIALLETLGPNPNATVEYLTQKAIKKAGDSGDKAAAKAEEREASRAKNVLSYIASQSERIEPSGAAKVLAGWRNLNQLKLAGAFVTNLADIGASHFQALATGQSNIGLFMQQLTRLNPADKSHRGLIENAGLVSEVMSGRVYRHMRDVADSGWTGSVSDAVMRASLMPKLQEWSHEAYTANLSNTLGRIVRDKPDMASLDGFDRKFFEGYGFTDAEFQLLKNGPLDAAGSFAKTMLTANTVDGISDAAIIAATNTKDPVAFRNALRDKVLGAIYTETTAGVVQPGAAVKSAMQFGQVKGSLTGEIVASMMQFKSFPIAMLMQNMQRARSFEGSGKYQYYAGMLLATTIAGAFVVQAKDMLAGKNPRDMSDYRFWTKAMLQGGSLGIYGDILFASNDSNMNNMAALVAGPVVQDIGQAASILSYPIRNASAGKEIDTDKLARDTITFTKGKTPGALLWYTRGIIDHAVLHEIQDELSPGYLHRMQSRAMREYGQSYWWEPGEAMPSEAPDFSEAWQR